MPSATVWFLLTLITTNHVLSLDTHYDHTSNVWDRHSVEEPFLTLWNLSLKTCVTKCQLRKACHAINYCRTRRSCQLLETDSGALPSQNVTEEFNVFVRMIDFRLTPQLAQTLSACNCTVNQTCLLHNASCIVTECRELKVANGVILGNMVNVGARVKVVCNDLYKLDNASQDLVVCRADGQWLPAITCAPYTACGPPPSVNNATFITFTNVSDVISAVYECDVGCDTPRALNDTSVECLRNNTWGAIGFECLAVCDAPPNVTMATVSVGENLHGFTKVYSCDSGRAVNGSANITCQADATWSQIQFECIVDCGAPPSVSNSVALAGNTVEESVRNYTCSAGYAPNSTSTLVTCQMDGNWTAVEFECIVDCGAPPTITNAEVSTGGTSEGDNRTYTCTNGHVFRNIVNTNITCRSDSMWSTASFDCLWDCGPAPTVQNATINVSDTVEASVGTYTCNTGFVANDTTTTITCQAEATWSNLAFYCIVDCGTPASFPNAQISVGTTLDANTRTYSCMTGYVLRNVVTVDTTCQSDGTWSVPKFDCLWDCGTPPPMPNGTVSSGDSVTGSTRNYTCDSGYGTTGTASITCQDGIFWSAPTSICTELVCDFSWHRIGESCYYLPGTGIKEVHDAMDICHSYNAYLVQLETQAEANAVESWLSTEASSAMVWIGITDKDDEGTWVWMNSSELATLTDWDSGQPNGGTNQNYCRLSNGVWEDKPYYYDYLPLCEKRFWYTSVDCAFERNLVGLYSQRERHLGFRTFAD